MADDRILEGYGGDAVAITAQVTLNPGDSIDLPADALRNGLGETVQIHALRWTIDAQQQLESADPPTTPAGFPGGSVTASLKLGDKPLTAGEIPFYCLGTATGQDVEHSILGVADDTNTEMLLGACSSGVWVFDHPMTFEAGESLSIHLTHRGLLNLPCAVSISLTGRAGTDLPDSKWLPYAASWTPAALNPTIPTATVPLVATSTERDLINRTPGTLYISRFIGRLLRLGVSGVPLGGATVVQNADRVFPSVQEGVSGQLSSGWFPGAVDSFLTVTMRDSRANDNIPGAIPFRMAFEPESRAWECPHTLEENGYYIVQLTLSNPAQDDASVQPSISMIGSWEGRA
jgi:hypothetical protein